MYGMHRLDQMLSKHPVGSPTCEGSETHAECWRTPSIPVLEPRHRNDGAGRWSLQEAYTRDKLSGTGLESNGKKPQRAAGKAKDLRALNLQAVFCPPCCVPCDRYLSSNTHTQANTQTNAQIHTKHNHLGTGIHILTHK